MGPPRARVRVWGIAWRGTSPRDREPADGFPQGVLSLALCCSRKQDTNGDADFSPAKRRR